MKILKHVYSGERMDRAISNGHFILLASCIEPVLAEHALHLELNTVLLMC